MYRIFLGLIVVLGGCAQAQDPAPLEGDGWTGLTEPDEVIEARRVLMTELQRQMEPVDNFTIGAPADPATLKRAAVTMEALLLAAPHLFPPTTNRFDPAVIESPTVALPEIWRDFSGFLAIAGASEMAAAALAAAEGADAVRTAGRNLRATCDSCHARFMRPYTPPEVSEDDLNFDFDSVLPDN